MSELPANPEQTNTHPGKRFDLQGWTLYIGTVLIIAIFAALCQMRGVHYLTLLNFTNVVVQSSMVAVVAIGASIVIIIGGIDLSVGGLVGLTGMISALLIMRVNLPIIPSLTAAVVFGCLFGVVSGIGVSYGKLPPFIMTLGMSGIAQGLMLALCKGKPVNRLPAALGAFAKTTWFGIPAFIYCVVISYMVMIFVMHRTRFGRRVYAVGGNPQAARLSGINVNRIEICVYAIAGFFSSIGGLMLLSRLNYASPTAGSGYEMDAIASVVIGGIALSGGQGRIGNSLVGALILGILKNGLQMLDVPSYYQQILTGIVIIAAVFMDKGKERRAE